MSSRTIEARLETNAEVSTSAGYSGTPSVTFDVRQAAEDLARQFPVTKQTLYKMLVEEDLGQGPGGSATFRLANHARSSQQEGVLWFFNFVGAAAELSVELGGSNVIVLDRRDFIRELAEANPSVFSQIDPAGLAGDLEEAYRDIFNTQPA